MHVVTENLQIIFKSGDNHVKYLQNWKFSIYDITDSMSVKLIMLLSGFV